MRIHIHMQETNFKCYPQKSRVISRSNRSEVFLGKTFLKTCSKITGEHIFYYTFAKSSNQKSLYSLDIQFLTRNICFLTEVNCLFM